MGVSDAKCIFERSVTTRGARYTKFLGDEDSKKLYFNQDVPKGWDQEARMCGKRIKECSIEIKKIKRMWRTLMGEEN